jgi:outer membrane protein OmpA-like peptidoglycan-associated protein
MKVKSSLLILLAGLSVFFSAGCATKTYVRQQTQPIIDKTNTLDELTAKNTRDIRDVDTRAQQGIQNVNQKVAEVDQKAVSAGSRADQAQTLATQANSRADALSTRVANLDNYRPVVETTVHFAFNHSELTDKAKDALDQLLAEVPNTKGYLVVVEGDTDSVGSATYNYKLSERRAEAVVQYLSEKNIPAHKIYVIGLGKDRTAAPNTTAEGRAKNRRVDVRLMTNTPEGGQISAQSTAPNPSR